MDFYARYLLTALLCGLAVWYGTPELQARRGFLPAVLDRIAPSALQDGGRDAGVPAEAPVEASVAQRRPPDARTAVLTVTAVTDPAEPRAAPGRPAALRADPPPRPSERRPAASSNDWGILAEAARAYSDSGQPQDRYAGGTVVEILSGHNSSSGRLLRCRVLVRQDWVDGLFFAEDAVVRFEGGFADAPHAERDQLIEYFQLKDKVATRRAELQEQVVRSNPHFSEYQAAARAMMEHQECTQDLAARRDAATGMQRSRLEDELRRLNAGRAEVQRRFKAVDEPYRRWRAENVEGSDASAADPRIRDWERRMEALEPAVRRMVSGL